MYRWEIYRNMDGSPIAPYVDYYYLSYYKGGKVAGIGKVEDIALEEILERSPHLKCGIDRIDVMRSHPNMSIGNSKLVKRYKL